MNILLTCVGRRNYLVDFFKEALHPLGGKVHAFNSDSASAALWQADVPVVSPFAHDPLYPEFLENYCTRHDIRAVISFMDVDLCILSGLKEKFSQLGITIIVADPWVTEMAEDKFLTHQFLVKHQFPVVPHFINLDVAMEAIHKGEASFPFYVKPRWGMGSIAVFKAENERDLSFYFYKTQQMISGTFTRYEMAKEEYGSVFIQGLCPGKEYGLDIINDLDGQHMVTVVKQKLAMRSGETDKAIIVKHESLEKLGAEIAALTRHPANMDVDVFWDGEKAYILEFNPRFGGGYPFSHAAGVNLPKAIIAWLQNEPVNTKELLSPNYGIEAMKGIAIIVKSE